VAKESQRAYRREKTSHRQKAGQPNSERMTNKEAFRPKVIPDPTPYEAMTNVIVRLPSLLIVAGLAIVTLGAIYYEYVATSQYEPQLLSFGVFVFAGGLTFWLGNATFRIHTLATCGLPLSSSLEVLLASHSTHYSRDSSGRPNWRIALISTH